jgi:hypothetical protein
LSLDSFKPLLTSSDYKFLTEFENQPSDSFLKSLLDIKNTGITKFTIVKSNFELRFLTREVENDKTGKIEPFSAGASLMVDTQLKLEKPGYKPFYLFIRSLGNSKANDYIYDVLHKHLDVKTGKVTPSNGLKIPNIYTIIIANPHTEQQHLPTNEKILTRGFTEPTSVPKLTSKISEIILSYLDKIDRKALAPPVLDNIFTTPKSQVISAFAKLLPKLNNFNKFAAPKVKKEEWGEDLATIIRFAAPKKQGKPHIVELALFADDDGTLSTGHYRFVGTDISGEQLDANDESKSGVIISSDLKKIVEEFAKLIDSDLSDFQEELQIEE